MHQLHWIIVALYSWQEEHILRIREMKQHTKKKKQKKEIRKAIEQLSYIFHDVNVM